jgi:CysZ protein
MSNHPGRGLQFLLEGFRLLRRPGIRPFVIIPLLVNMALFGLGLWWGYQQIDTLNTLVLDALPGWLAWLSWLLWPLFFLVAVLLVFYGFSLAANLIASPFNGFLAEKVEQLLSGEAPADTIDWRELLLMVPRSILRELLKMAYYLPRVLVVFLITLIPSVNVISPVLWFLLGAWMMTIQYIDYPIDNHRLGFAKVRQGVRCQRGVSLGFGGAVMLCTMVPIVNLFIMPAAICGATAWWVSELKRELLTDRNAS